MIDEEQIKQHLGTALRRMIDEGKLEKVRGSYKLASHWKSEWLGEKGRKTAKKTGRKVTKKKKGGKKDKDAPKRAKSAYLFFSVKERAELKKKNPDLAFGELSKKVAKKWNNASDATRKKYEEKAVEDKKRYAREMKAYRKKKKEESSTSSEEESSSSEESSEESS